MNRDLNTFTTGLPGLDQTLQGLRAGDNVVWQVDNIDDYLPFVVPFWNQARAQGRKLIYFRFARHRELFQEGCGGEIYRLHPEDGFEKFLTEMLDIIEHAGLGACYVFDWLSDLAADWYSDRMLGNFFMITCPYLYDLKTIAYFGLRKNQHSFHATDGIDNTAQVILEVYRKKQHLFVHPQKVWQRHTPTMYTLHQWEGDQFKPVTSSAVTTEILAGVPQPWLDFSVHRLGVWTRTFRQAQGTLNAVRNGKKSPAEAEAFFFRVLRMVVTRDDRFAHLAHKYFELPDVIEIMKRMIGTGLIGGKSLGMLLARAILKKASPHWGELLERHDSFFIGSDVFYTYLVQNGCWWLRRRQKDFNLFLEKAEEARLRILQGQFPEYIQGQFQEMLEYFGQSPIIVRSSSLLEDNYGNAFSGKYESVFCANQGSPQERLNAFMEAVRTVYASTMSRAGLEYRRHHGLLDQDEQMALLVQRVSGEMYGSLFFPHAAGVGFSFNPYVWHEDIDPKAGFLRLVFGLGTRAVDRTGDDYTRLVALNDPGRRPETAEGGERQYSQRRVDVLDLQANKLDTETLEKVAPLLPPALFAHFASLDEDYVERMRGVKTDQYNPWVLNCQQLLTETNFAEDMRQLLAILEAAYDNPVDIEFTVNFLANGRYCVNLVQCRPFQVKIRGQGSRVKFPTWLRPEHVLLASTGPVVGQSLSTHIDRLIYVVPSVYGLMPMSQRYSIARIIGQLTHLDAPELHKTIMLVGPGRWGTSMPSLGVPVSFAEINTVTVLGEIALMREGLVPDVSLGTHFFNDLVEMDMLYLAVSPEKEGCQLNESILDMAPNLLAQLLPNAAQWASAIRVIDSPNDEHGIFLNVDSLKQKAVCYIENEK
jgi:hypothetical protein